jgi:hypothetical protein
MMCETLVYTGMEKGRCALLKNDTIEEFQGKTA